MQDESAPAPAASAPGKRSSPFAITVTLLSTFCGGLSLASLVHSYLEFGWSAPIEALMSWYQQFLKVTLGWAEPWINRFLSQIHWNLHLVEDWRNNLIAIPAFWVPAGSFVIRDQDWKRAGPRDWFRVCIVVATGIFVLLCTLLIEPTAETRNFGWAMIIIAFGFVTLTVVALCVAEILSRWRLLGKARSMAAPRYARQYRLALTCFMPVLAATFVIATSAGLAALGL